MDSVSSRRCPAWLLLNSYSAKLKKLANADFVDEAIEDEVAEIEEVAEIAGGGNDAANEQTSANEQTAANKQSAQAAANVQLELTAATNAAKAAQARVARKAMLLDKAQMAMLKYHDSIPSVSDTEWLDLLKWVFMALTKKFRVMDHTTKEAVLAKVASLERARVSYIPHWAPLANVPV